MPVPVALGAPAVVAGLAYLDAKFHIRHDLRFLSGAIAGSRKLSKRESTGRMSLFYSLEELALDDKFAGKTFLIYENRRWTYKQVYDMVLKYGTWFKTEYGVRHGDIVAMDFANSDIFVLVWLGLYSIGATPAFINYNLTGKALMHCIKVSTAKVAIIDSAYESNITVDIQDELPHVKFVTLTPEREGAIIATTGIREPDSERASYRPQDIAVLVYTSGTTGLPKPAILPWSKFIVSGALLRSWTGSNANDIFYTSMPMYHSSATLMGFGFMVGCGGTFAIGRKFSTKSFWPEVRAYDATIIQYVGETCRYLLSAPPQCDPVTGENLDRKHKVRVALGNGLRPDVWNKFKERFGIDEIAEFYSATEGHGALWNYSRNDWAKGAVGRGGFLLHTSPALKGFYVEVDWETEAPWRDPQTGFCKKVRNGEPGEALFKLDPKDISRAYQGYYNNEKASGSKILRDVFQKGDAYYRTGDVLRRDSEGRIYFSDRIGDTFRWKGENVSTNEVSELLGSHPAIQEANVYGVQLPHHDGRAGAAQLTLKEQPTVEMMTTLAEHARKELPRFAVPLFLRITNDMQITGTNKQQKSVVRTEGVDPSRTRGDAMYWLKNGCYVEFAEKDWADLKSGRVKL